MPVGRHRSYCLTFNNRPHRTLLRKNGLETESYPANRLASDLNGCFPPYLTLNVIFKRAKDNAGSQAIILIKTNGRYSFWLLPLIHIIWEAFCEYKRLLLHSYNNLPLPFTAICDASGKTHPSTSIKIVEWPVCCGNEEMLQIRISTIFLRPWVFLCERLQNAV